MEIPCLHPSSPQAALKREGCHTASHRAHFACPVANFPSSSVPLDRRSSKKHLEEHFSFYAPSPLYPSSFKELLRAYVQAGVCRGEQSQWIYSRSHIPVNPHQILPFRRRNSSFLMCASWNPLWPWIIKFIISVIKQDGVLKDWIIKRVL